MEPSPTVSERLPAPKQGCQALRMPGWVPSQTRLSSGVDVRVEIRGNSELFADRWTQKAASPFVEEGPAQVTYRPREFPLGGEWG